MDTNRVNFSKVVRPVAPVKIQTVARLVKADNLASVRMLSDLGISDDIVRANYAPFIHFAQMATDGRLELAIKNVNGRLDRMTQTDALKSVRTHSLETLRWLAYEFSKSKLKITQTLANEKTRVIAPSLAGLPLKGGFQWVTTDAKNQEYLTYCWMGDHKKEDILYIKELLYVMAEQEFGNDHPPILYCDSRFALVTKLDGPKRTRRESIIRVIKSRFEVS